MIRNGMIVTGTVLQYKLSAYAVVFLKRYHMIISIRVAIFVLVLIQMHLNNLSFCETNQIHHEECTMRVFGTFL